MNLAQQVQALRKTMQKPRAPLAVTTPNTTKVLQALQAVKNKTL